MDFVPYEGGSHFDLLAKSDLSILAKDMHHAPMWWRFQTQGVQVEEDAQHRWREGITSLNPSYSSSDVFL